MGTLLLLLCCSQDMDMEIPHSDSNIARKEIAQCKVTVHQQQQEIDRLLCGCWFGSTPRAVASRTAFSGGAMSISTTRRLWLRLSHSRPNQLVHYGLTGTCERTRRGFAFLFKRRGKEEEPIYQSPINSRQYARLEVRLPITTLRSKRVDKNSTRASHSTLDPLLLLW
ncbi:unnamed protein product [Amoebophrya sp. A25]|nr:unnamed protein product [Amoebophrya sp. A25]CAD7976909.1 unnamed protein product [Amoebophrya sp. A25]|eukprot:GSA25T00027039001.1